MNRRPSSWEDPPEDPPEEDPTEPDYGADWDTPTNHPYVDRDCDYWERLK